MKNNTSKLPSNPKEPKARYYLCLTKSELIKLNELSKSLNMSKSKIVRIMVIENANIMLCNTVELIKSLDSIGIQLAQIRNSLDSSISNYFTKVKRPHTNMNISSSTIASVEEYFHLLGKLEAAFSELLKVVKKMK